MHSLRKQNRFEIIADSVCANFSGSSKLVPSVRNERTRSSDSEPASRRPSAPRNPRRQKQSSEAIMSFRMQNSSFRLAALGTFTFKCKLAECAPQSHPRHILPHQATDPFSTPFATSRPPSLHIVHPYPRTVSIRLLHHLLFLLFLLLSFEDVGDMAEAPGFNILHLKCWARARQPAMQNSSSSIPRAAGLFPPSPSITIPSPFGLDWI